MLVIQERRRFYRESMTVFLRRQLRTTEVIDGVADADGLLAAAAEGPLDHAVIEADGVPWDVCALAASLRARHRDIRLIGLTASSRPSPLGGLNLLPRRATPDQVVKLVEPDVDRSHTVRPQRCHRQRQWASHGPTVARPRFAQPRPHRIGCRRPSRSVRAWRRQVEDGDIHKARRSEPGPGRRHCAGQWPARPVHRLDAHMNRPLTSNGALAPHEAAWHMGNAAAADGGRADAAAFGVWAVGVHRRAPGKS